MCKVKIIKGEHSGLTGTLVGMFWYINVALVEVNGDTIDVGIDDIITI